MESNRTLMWRHVAEQILEGLEKLFSKYRENIRPTIAILKTNHSGLMLFKRYIRTLSYNLCCVLCVLTYKRSSSVRCVNDNFNKEGDYIPHNALIFLFLNSTAFSAALICVMYVYQLHKTNSHLPHLFPHYGGILLLAYL